MISYRFVFVIVPFALLAWAGCRKEDERPNYDLTADDLQWLPYETVGFQPFYMRDETGYVHRLNLHYEETRDFYGADENQRPEQFYERRFVAIHLGRHGTGCFLKRGRGGFELGIYDHAVYGFAFDNATLQNPEDSMVIHGRTFNNVVTTELDSLTVNSQEMWKVYVSKGKGIVGAEYRNGKYYVME